ncbi:crossover junction endodeoxyribonuclease RuvC [Candidatus Uhrbacteria bacterium CG_4_9_14_3_um_filter_36_7]|uniref:Crossover junction endodeoxyribonuclease RuvC n=1 Tax=Candidatus Uhrbacteria bacterium CG_4_9_14_3_um_filter_36_7 TaxID=1975033 RepID=A0A2M7XGT3_9BACT|nr:MAG: crossover junction endodeoxyribonuclease RuvC [Candidatus Uhrbacteria bacterium CG_4_9_14_3_um_filter_36_7]
MDNIILGIDPGFGRMGFGVVAVRERVCEAIDYGVMTTSSGILIQDRLVALADDLQSLLDTHKPSVLVMEKLFFTNNQKTAIRVAEARGVILFLAGQYQLPVIEFTPTQVKSALTGDGKANKSAMQRMVKQLLGLKTIPKPDDAADALAIAITASTVRW